MKTLAILALLLASTVQQAHAEARQFRISEGTAFGVAIGWGVKDTLVDFEKIEAEGKEDEFIDKNYDKLQNYLIDLKTNRILAVIAGAGTDNDRISGRIGHIHLGNNYGMGLQDLDFSSEILGNNERATIVMQLNSYKWSDELANIFVIQNEKDGVNGFEPTVVAQCKDCPKQIDAAIKTKMSKEDAALLDKLYAQNHTFKKSETTDYKPRLSMTLSADGGKSELTDVITVDATFKYEVKAGAVVLTLDTFKMTHSK